MEMEFKFREGTLHVHAGSFAMKVCGRNQAEDNCPIQNEGTEFIDGQANPEICAACIRRTQELEA